MIKADTASAIAEAPTGAILVFSILGILGVGAAAAYTFIFRPRRLARRVGGHRA